MLPVVLVAFMTAEGWTDQLDRGSIGIQFSNVFFPWLLLAVAALFLRAGRLVWDMRPNAPRMARWAAVPMLLLVPVGTALAIALFILLRPGAPLTMAFPMPVRTLPPAPPSY
jgi:hypothetical protein